MMRKVLLVASTRLQACTTQLEQARMRLRNRT